MRRQLFFCLNLLIAFPLVASPRTLTSSDVQPVMQRLFHYHIEKKEMSELIAQRSLKIYVKHFDPTFAYLYEDEATAYMRPSGQLLEVVVEGYQREDFATYFQLNSTIEISIKRAQGWRRVWQKDPVALVKEAKSVSLSSKLPKEYARSETELQQRHKDRMLKLIAFTMADVGEKECRGKEDRLIALIERQLQASENRYLGIDDEGVVLSAEGKEHQIIQRTIKSFAYSLDAHTAYFSPDEAYAMKVQLQKGMCGIGVVLREGIEGVTIHDILKGGPASKEGSIQTGDAIIEVNGENVREANFKHVLDVMRGKAGSHMTLGIQRNNQLFHVELVREQISIDDKRVDVEAEPYGDGYIGRIKLHSFYDGESGINSEKDLREAIDSLKAKGPLEGIVLDLRDNTGGFLTQAVKVAGLFISNGIVVIAKYSDGSEKFFRTVDGQKAFDGPIVVLVSRNSASAAEIVAQALQDYGVAIVVGDEQTYGKGTIQHQTITDKRSDSFFKVTVGRYYTASGKSTQIMGVRSDIVIPTSVYFEEIGESYLEYPVAADRTDPVFNDPLSDIDPYARKWFTKYYLPQVEPVHPEWHALVPTLARNSELRQRQNRNFQLFLKRAKERSLDVEFGSNDLQMDEASNVLKEMIYLSSERVWELSTH
ncbi:MAG: hypothetical protein SP1CHLAM42_14590 [Chlamydiales bacterium]|nr:hypothetical protein [Chlamydiales bacterium]